MGNNNSCSECWKITFPLFSSYAPAQVQYGQSIKIAHFIGQNKPWKYQRFADGKVLPMGDAWEGTSRMVQTWWDTWDKYYGRVSVSDKIYDVYSTSTIDFSISITFIRDIHI